MFQYDAQLIQVELGTKALEVFSTKDMRGLLGKLVGQRPPEWTDDLEKATNKLRENLSAEGITLPAVLFSPSPEFPPNVFRITLGVAVKDYDIYKDNYLYVLEKRVRAYQSSAITKENVENLLKEAIKNVLEKKFQQAMELLMKVYYLSSLIEYEIVRVISLLNIAGICLVNNQLDSANLISRQAQILVEKDSFFEPYLKFFAHKVIANVTALYGDYEKSAALFEQAFIDISNFESERYMIDALYNEATVLMRMGAYGKCTKVLDKIVSCIKNSNDYNKEILLKLYEMRAFIADSAIDEIMGKLNQLQDNYNYLTNSFLLKTENAILTVVSQCGPYFITAFFGALLGGDKYNVNQNNVNGNNIIGGKV